MLQHNPNLDTIIIDTVGALVMATDLQGRIIRFNAGGSRMMGYEEQEILNRLLWDVFSPPELRQRAKERFEGLIAGGSLQADTVWLTRSGERKHLSFYCVGVAGPSGRIEYTIGTGVDVTARVEMEEALRESEERFRSIFADAAIGMALVNDKGRYLHVNRAFCHLTGYDEAELLQRDILSITHPDDWKRNMEMFQSLFTGERQAYVLEKRYIRRGGEPVWAQVSSSVATDSHGRPATVIGLFENISERKAAEEAVRKSYAQVQALNETLEQRVIVRTAELEARSEELIRSKHELVEQSRILRSILESMGDGVFVADETGRLVLINPAAERISGGLEPGRDMVSVRSLQPWFFHADGKTRCLPEELPLIRSTHGQDVDDQEILVRRPGRPQVWTSATARPLRDEAGKINGAVVVVRDVTERKRHEAELREANASLERANAALRESERHYRELSESHLRLAREVEHRVRNNLQGLLGLLSVTRDRAADVQSFADAMESRLAAMQHVHQLLAQTRWKGVGLRSLIDGALSTLQHMACEPADLSIRGPDVFISVRQMLPLTLVIVEWFTNSCKYGPHSVKGGKLDIAWDILPDSSPTRVRLTWTERGGPPVRGPIIASLGTELVHGFVGNELAGSVALRYPPEGAEYMLEFTVREEERDQKSE